MDIRTLVNPLWQQKPVQATTRLHSSSKITTNLSLISNNFNLDIRPISICVSIIYIQLVYSLEFFCPLPSFFVFFLTYYPIIKTFINCFPHGGPACNLPCSSPSLISSRFLTLLDLNMYYMIIGGKLDGSQPIR